MVIARLRTPLVALGMTGLIASGCARWIAVTPAPDGARESAIHSISSSERVPLVIDRLRVTQNGASQHAPTELERRVVGAIHDTHLFSTLVPLGEAPLSHDDKTVIARLTFDETIDPHAGQTAWKSFVVGASMFLLAPFVELDYDYTSHATLELERWDGHVKRYDARFAGTAHYNVFGATPIMIEELKGQVVDACLTDLTDQLVRDTAFYLAGSAPLPDATIRSVTVTSRRYHPPPATPSATAISSTPQP